MPRSAAQTGAAAQKTSPKEPTTSKSLDRSLSILEVVAQEDGLSLSDIAMRTGIPASTAHRILATLEAHKFVAEDDERRLWFIGVNAFQIGNAFLRNRKLVEIGRRTMRDLMQATGESINLAILDGVEVVFISQVESHATIRAFHRPGSRSALHASATGKALLAAMDEDLARKLLQQAGMQKFTATTVTSAKALFEELGTIRQRGWAANNEERDPDMRCVAAVIYNEYAEPIAALSISGPTSRMPLDRLGELGPQIKRAAAEIVISIGGAYPATA